MRKLNTKSKFLALAGLISAATLVLGPARLASAQVVAPSWSYTGNLNAARFRNTATLLPNGKVLVAGGNYVQCCDLTAELYDPATGSWSSTGSATWNRGTGLYPPGSFDNTATLLPSGKVLVAGGDLGDSPFSSAELYDPATGTWSITGSLNAERQNHTATLLPNGKVLVVGGFDYDFEDSLKSVELYDPGTGRWSSTGSLNTSRVYHTATLLPSGQVLVVGGFDGGAFDIHQALSSAELYDPATGAWSSTGSLNTARIAHAATLLPGGKVLVAGGNDINGARSSALNSAELYDPATGTWSSTGNLNTARNSPTATLLPSGQVLVVGGFDGGAFDIHQALSSAELYDSATGTWSNTASLNTARVYHTATLLPSGKVLVAVGSSDNTAEVYNPGASQTPNPIDDVRFFVQQHYRDFLNREPDADGLAFWTNEIAMCGADQGCIEAKRINVSAAFFLSIEFQQTGYLVYRFYKASYGNLPGAPVPIKLNEFLADTKEIGQGVIVNQSGWETTLENNKQAFTSEFVQRSRFTSAYPTSLSPSEFVDTFFANADVRPSTTDRTAAISEFDSGNNTADIEARARALRSVAENTTLAEQEFDRAFVLMQYFGYLRRNPNNPPEPTLDFQGYNFWLIKLNSFNGNFANAEMVETFLVSGEYRQRFGTP